MATVKKSAKKKVAVKKKAAPKKRKAVAKKKAATKKKVATKKRVKKSASLTSKQQLFVDEYLKDMNATQAAIRAGYSVKTAEAQASRLLRNVNVAEAVKKAMEKRSERTQIDADWLLNRFVDEVEADLADLYDEGGALKPVHQWPKIWRQGLVAGIEAHQEYAYKDGRKVPDGVVMKVKLSDRVRRLEMIGKHVNVQAFKDRVEHSGKIDLSGKTDAELQAIINGSS